MSEAESPTAKVKPGQRVLITLRTMIASGELASGTRIAEIPTAEALGVSRMPVRLAFRLLEQEGLLVRNGVRGYAVRGFSRDDIIGAIEVRGVLEGLAARQLAQKGLSKPVQKTLLTCLSTGDSIFAKQYLSETDLEAYHAFNQRFHQAIVVGSGNTAIASALSRNNSLPFASATAMALDQTHLDQEFQRLAKAHQQHHGVYQALVESRAEDAFRLMEEHAKITLENGMLGMKGETESPSAPSPTE